MGTAGVEQLSKHVEHALELRQKGGSARREVSPGFTAVADPVVADRPKPSSSARLIPSISPSFLKGI